MNDLNPISRKFLNEIQSFVKNYSTKSISSDNLFNTENWESVDNSNVEEAIEDLCVQGYLQKYDDTTFGVQITTVQGSDIYKEYFPDE